MELLRSRTLVALALLVAAQVRAECPAPQPLPRERIHIIGATGEKRLDVEIADTEAARSAGLMCRTALAVNHGMLFVYPRAQVARMWMKNTWLSLDMLFIAADGRIVKIVPDVAPREPGRISADQRVKMVLELPAGTAARLDIRTGDLVRRPPKPSPRASG